MRTRRWPALGAAVVTAAALWVAPAASAATACTVTDPRGDARGVALGVSQPVHDEPGLDVTAARLEWQATAQRLVATVDVADLRDDGLPPPGSNGEHVDVTFVLGGQTHYLQYSRSFAESTEGFAFGRIGPFGREVLADSAAGNVHGSVDRVANRIRVELPARVLQSGAEVFALADGDQLSQLGVAARRELLVLLPDADQAASTDGCVVATTGAAGPAEALRRVGDRVVATGNVVAGAAGVCAEGCWTRRLAVTPPAGAALRVRITRAPDDAVTDLDLVLWGPGGRVWRSERAGSIEEIVVHPPAPGWYEVEVTAYTAALAGFEVTVELVSA